MKRLLPVAVLLASLFGHAVSASAQKASFQILTPPTGLFFASFALNADGTKMAINTGGEIFLWTKGKYTDLGPGGVSNGLIAISADGTTIVTDRIGVDGLDSPARWTAAAGWTDLLHPSNGCSLGGSWGSGYSVSGNGAVAVGLSWVCGGGSAEGFRWDSYRGMMSLGHPTGASSRASAISADASTIVGFYEDPTQGNRRAIRWLPGKKDFIAGAHNPGEATAVSSDGTQIAGQATLGTNLPYAFYYTDKGGLVSLGSITNDTCDPSFANSISDNGKVVGFSGSQFFCNGNQAFIWDAKSPQLKMQSLAKYLVKRGAKVPSRLTLTDAFSISADGSTVVGTWQDATFHFGAFIAKLR